MDIKTITKEFEALPPTVQYWLMEIAAEHKRAVDKHPKWPNDLIHGAAIVGEESGELIRATLQYKYEKGQASEVLKEAVHTGAMAIRFLTEIEKGEWE